MGRIFTFRAAPMEGCEYSFDGSIWSDNNVKTGVKAGETVTAYIRYKESDTCNAGGESSEDAESESSADDGETEFICADETAADGTALPAFSHASDYDITVDDGQEEESAAEDAQTEEANAAKEAQTETTQPEGAQPEETDESSTNGGEAEESPNVIQEKKNVWMLPVAAGILALIVTGIVILLVWRRKTSHSSEIVL